MKHLPEGSLAYRVRLENHGENVDFDIRQVRVALQHESLGTFLDDGERVVQALHGELHSTREEAEDFLVRMLSVVGSPASLAAMARIAAMRQVVAVS